VGRELHLNEQKKKKVGELKTQPFLLLLDDFACVVSSSTQKWGEVRKAE